MSDFSEVRSAARGQWSWVLAALGVDGDTLTHKHGPCPGCGGKDRFRYDDRDGLGTWICGGGGGDALSGDGFALLEHVHGWDIKTAFARVAGCLGIDERGEASPEERARWRAERERAERIERDRVAGLGLLQELDLLAAVLRRKWLGQEAGPVAVAAPEVDARARAIWGRSSLEGRSEYLERKQVLGHGVKYRDGLLVVPVRDIGGRLCSLQHVGPDGTKRFLGAGPQLGTMHFIGEGVTARPSARKETGKDGLERWIREDAAAPELICIGEGYATVASVHELMDWPGVVAFTGANLQVVARAVRFRWPRAFLVVLGDFDLKEGKLPGDPGVSSAQDAADACGGVAVWPAIEDGQSWDWNDVQVRQGAQAMGALLRERLAAAKAGYQERIREAARRAQVLLADQFGRGQVGVS